MEVRLSGYFVMKRVRTLEVSEGEIQNCLDVFSALPLDADRVTVEEIKAAHSGWFADCAKRSADEWMGKINSAPGNDCLRCHTGGRGRKRSYWFTLDVPVKDRPVPKPTNISLAERPVVLVLTFNDREYDAVRSAFEETVHECVDGRSNQDYVVLSDDCQGSRVLLRHCSQGEASAQQAVDDAVRDWRTLRAAVAVGIGYSREDRLGLGDVGVSTSTYLVDHKRENPEGAKPLGEPLSADLSLRDRMMAVDKFHERYDPLWPTVKLGPVASSNAIINSPDVRDAVFDDARHPLIGDMEAYGLARACASRRIDWLVIKAVCDTGTDKNDRYQKLAARHSAHVFRSWLSHAPIEHWFEEIRRPSTTEVARVADKLPFERVTPHHLGRRREGFVNRTDELARLDSAAKNTSGSSRLLVLEGLQGAGKSRLAEEWAQRQKDRYPDGQLYLDFRTLPASPSSLAEALRFSLEAMGCPAKRIPERLSERQGLYRTVTANQHMMLLLDHVSEAGEVQGLLPDAPDTLVVVTTNSDMWLLRAEGAQEIPVGALDPSHARIMLQTLVGDAPRGSQEEQACEAVLSYCGGLPLALELCATQIREEGGGWYAWLAERLGDARTRLQRIGGPSVNLDVVFASAYAALPDDLARAYRLIGLAPRLNTWAQASAVLGAEELPAKRLVSLLAARHLVECDEGGVGSAGDRLDIGMHDLLRLHARKLSLTANPEESTALAHRIGQYAAVRARQIDYAISPERLRIDLPSWCPETARGDGARQDVTDLVIADGAEAGRQFSIERPFILAAQIAAEAAGDDATACVIADALWPAMYGRGYDREIAGVLTVGVEAAARLGEPLVLCRLRMLLARGLGFREEYDEAIGQSRLAVQLAREQGDDWMLGSALEVQGLLLLDSCGPEEALPVFEEARSCFPEDQVRGKAIQDLHIGICLSRLGQPEEAVGAFDRAMAAFGSLRDHLQLARTGWRLAEVLVELDSKERALAVATAAAQESTLSGEYRAQGHAMLVLAELQEDPDICREELRAAVEAFTEVADDALVAVANDRLEALAAS